MKQALTRLAPEVRQAMRLTLSRRYSMNLTTAELTALSREERVKKNLISMDCLPAPAGDWATENAKRQSKYNLHLIVSIGIFTASLVWLYQSSPVVYPDLYAPLNLAEVLARRKAEAEE